MNKYPEMLPPFLGSYKSWDKDVANAFALGLALGKQCYKPNTPIFLTIKEGRYKWREVRIAMKALQSAITANLEWKDGNKAYNPFAELFNIEKFKNLVGVEKPEDVRCLVADLARNAAAMIAIDVAILKWLVHAITTKPVGSSYVLKIKEAIFMPLIALSMHPSIGAYCKDDILTVLTEVQCGISINLGLIYPNLITLFKLLDDGLVRKKVEEIITVSCPTTEEIFLTTRLLLGDDHPLVKAREDKLSEGERLSYDVLFRLQIECQRKVYSIGYTFIFSFRARFAFILIPQCTKLSAKIEADSTLTWERPTSDFGRIEIFNRPESSPLYLLIFSQVPAPAIFWQTIASCTSLPRFQKVISRLAMRQMILTYGITIMEDCSHYQSN